jgi:hypothetical protein
MERACALQWMGGYMGHIVSLDALKIKGGCAPARNYTPVIGAIALTPPSELFLLLVNTPIFSV